MALNAYDKNVIALILRSPDIGDGWRNVSSVCMALLPRITAAEIFEVTRNADGSGNVRLSDRGVVVAAYI